jgi:hypothetical protein
MYFFNIKMMYKAIKHAQIYDIKNKYILDILLQICFFEHKYELK